MVSGTRFQGKFDTCATTPCPELDQDWALGFVNETHTVIALWSVSSAPHRMHLQFATGTWESFDWQGEALGVVRPPQRGGHVQIFSNQTCGDIYEDVDAVPQCAPIYLVQRSTA
jgi:hypothetical protein